MKKTIYQMKLHESLKIETDLLDYFVTRVAGGWIYETSVTEDQSSSMLFIPFSNEFQVKSMELPGITGEAPTNGQLSSSNGELTMPAPDPLRNMKNNSRRLLRALLVQYKGDQKKLDVSVRRLAVDSRVTNINTFLKEISSRGLCELSKSDHKKRKRILSFRLTVPAQTQQALQV